ncbi:MAG: FAD-dependent oxidoreductase, partial [Myxococcales bacterium]|nr:FAD-dependent oxidoreductase [Myxococcales bacterium]
MRVAVVGAGIAGLGAAWRLRTVADVVLFEAEDRVGGHALTVDVPLHGADPAVGTWPVDVGFQVWSPAFNPNLAALLKAVGVQPRPLAFSLTSQIGGEVWTSNGQPTAVGARLAAEFERFAVVAGQPLAPTASFGDLLTAHGFSTEFIQRCLGPLISFWWVSRTALLDTPAVLLLPIFAFKALAFDRPSPWAGIEGGSRTTCERLAATLGDGLRLGQPVKRLVRRDDGVRLETGAGAEDFDHVVLAIDAPTALRLLDAPTEAEAAVLGGVRMLRSTLVVHRDPKVMPADKAMWAYGNYVDPNPPGPVGELAGWMTYCPPPPAGAEPVFVTVGEAAPIDPATVLQ